MKLWLYKYIIPRCKIHNEEMIILAGSLEIVGFLFSSDLSSDVANMDIVKVSLATRWHKKYNPRQHCPIFEIFSD